MQKVTLENQDYVLDLTWHHIDASQSIENEIKRAVTQYRLDYGVLQKSAGRACVGLTTAAFKGAISAAAHLAEAEPHIMLVEQINNNQYWVVAIMNGLVMPMSDVIVSKETLQATLSNIWGTVKKYEQDLGVKFRLCTTIGIDAEDFEHIGFAELVSNIKPKPRDKVDKLSSVTTNKKTVIAVIAVAIFGYVIYDKFFSSNDLPAIDPNIVQNVIPQKQEIDPAVIRKQYEDALLKDVNKVLSWYEPDNRFNKFEALLKNFNMYYTGWEMTNIKFSGTDNAMIDYKQTELGRIKKLNSEVGKFSTFSLTPDGKSVTYTVPVGSFPPVVHKMQNLNDFKAYNWVDLANTFQKWSQEIQWTINPSASQASGIILPTLGNYPDQVPPFKSYRWEITTNEVFRFHEIRNTLNEFKNVVVESIDVNVSGNTLKITGVIYAAT